jgi:hypothetical protein
MLCPDENPGCREWLASLSVTFFSIFPSPDKVAKLQNDISNFSCTYQSKFLKMKPPS